MSWFLFNLNDFSLSFLSILFEGVPYLLAGTLLAGVIDTFLPSETLDRWLPRHAGLAVLVAGMAGMVFPMCECGIVPVIRRMIRKGLPVGPAVTYLLAAPILNPVVGLSTYAAFRGQDPALVTGLRFGLGFLIAATAGLLMQRVAMERVLNPDLIASLPRQRRMPKALPVLTPEAPAKNDFLDFSPRPAEPAPLSAPAPDPAPRGSRWLGALRTACYDFVDVAFYLVIGAMITALFNTAVNQDIVIQPLASNVWVATGTMQLLAGVLALCSTTDAFIAANFVAFPLAAKLAFMVLGPMMDVKLLFLYGLVFRKKFTFTLAVSLFVVIGLLSIAATHWLT